MVIKNYKAHWDKASPFGDHSFYVFFIVNDLYYNNIGLKFMILYYFIWYSNNNTIAYCTI